MQKVSPQPLSVKVFLFMLTYEFSLSKILIENGGFFGEGLMKQSTQVRIFAILILVVLAAIDAFSMFVPVVAFIGIVLILWRPKWLRTFIEKAYE